MERCYYHAAIVHTGHNRREFPFLAKLHCTNFFGQIDATMGINAVPVEMVTPMKIVKYQPPMRPPSVDSLLLAYFLMFARAPRKAEPDADGFYDLSEIGPDVEKNWSRLTPYSPSQRQR